MRAVDCPYRIDCAVHVIGARAAVNVHIDKAGRDVGAFDDRHTAGTPPADGNDASAFAYDVRILRQAVRKVSCAISSARDALPVALNATATTLAWCRSTRAANSPLVSRIIDLLPSSCRERPEGDAAQQPSYTYAPWSGVTRFRSRRTIERPGYALQPLSKSTLRYSMTITWSP